MLTIFTIICYFHLGLLSCFKGVQNLPDSLGISILALQKITRARPLHEICPGISRQLAESIITIYNCPSLDLSVGDDEIPI